MHRKRVSCDFYAIFKEKSREFANQNLLFGIEIIVFENDPNSRVELMEGDSGESKPDTQTASIGSRKAEFEVTVFKEKC